tara:strand:+ start:1608 stop:1814 length:207 start_codon:yes stop_codon:yes gene_type:complete
MEDKHEDEQDQANMDDYERRLQANCEQYDWELDEHSIEKGYIGGSEVLMATLVCANCGKQVHVEGVIE